LGGIQKKEGDGRFAQSKENGKGFRGDQANFKRKNDNIGQNLSGPAMTKGPWKGWISPERKRKENY